MNENITAIVLAGGQGKRLGQAKATLKLGDRTIIEDVVDEMADIADEVIVVTSQSQNHLPHNLNAQVFTDIHPGKSALGGVYTGLMKSSNYYNLVVACDMPFLNLNLLKHMILLTSGVDIVTIKLGRNVEPLHAVYSKGCIEHIEGMFEKDDLQVSHLLDAVKVRYINEDELDEYDPRHLSFFNINNKTDLVRARKLKEAAAK
ncbi:molybdenum cofactor guanylyltransferase [Chloroflexota bacterium]